MPAFESSLATDGAAFAENRAHMLGLLAELQALQARTEAASAHSGPRFAKRGQLLPRERLGLLLDGGTPFLPLAALAGYLIDVDDPTTSVPGGGCVAGIGSIAGTRCMIVADDSGIEAGALQPMGLEKFQRAQQLSLENRLPFVHLVESAGANLLRYRVEDFINGGSHYCRLARLSAAGIPVVTVVHGSSTAGGAYMPGLSGRTKILSEGNVARFGWPAVASPQQLTRTCALGSLELTQQQLRKGSRGGQVH